MHTVLGVLQTSLLPARKCQQFISGHHGPSSAHVMYHSTNAEACTLSSKCYGPDVCH